jgi:hypothetical protein
MKPLQRLFRALLLLLIVGNPALTTAAARELNDQELERVIFTIDATRHRLPPTSLWLRSESQALLMGFTHVMNSIVPAELESRLREISAAGVTDLILESAEGSEYCRQFVEIARGAVPSSAVLERWEIVYGPSYYSLLQSAEKFGIRVDCGDRPTVPGETASSEELFQLRNEHLAWKLTRMVEGGRKPLLLIGAYHVNPVKELMIWLGGRRSGMKPTLDAYHASEIDGHYAPSEGLLYPDIGQMLRALGREVFFRANAIDRVPETAFGSSGDRCLSCPPVENLY